MFTLSSWRVLQNGIQLPASGFEQAAETLREIRSTNHPMARLGRQTIQPGEPLLAAQQMMIEE
jgi:hypothetical protein